MNVSKRYPEGAKPTQGPFHCGTVEVCAHAGYVVERDMDTGNLTRLTPEMAREKASALIECADCLDVAAMSPDDVRNETLLRA